MYDSEFHPLAPHDKAPTDKEFLVLIGDCWVSILSSITGLPVVLQLTQDGKEHAAFFAAKHAVKKKYNRAKPAEPQKRATLMAEPATLDDKLHISFLNKTFCLNASELLRDASDLPYKDIFWKLVEEYDVYEFEDYDEEEEDEVPREASAGELLLKQSEVFVSANERREDKDRAAAERREDKERAAAKEREERATAKEREERAAAERREERWFQLLSGQKRSPPSSDIDEPRSKRKR